MTCQARQQSDEMYCAKCNLRWDANDSDPPKCLPDPKPLVNRFSGTCIRCGLTVAADQGYVQIGATPFTASWGFHKASNTVYVEHRECHEKFKGTNTHHRLFPHRGDQ